MYFDDCQCDCKFSIRIFLANKPNILLNNKENNQNFNITKYVNLEVYCYM